MMKFSKRVERKKTPGRHNHEQKEIRSSQYKKFGVKNQFYHNAAIRISSNFDLQRISINDQLAVKKFQFPYCRRTYITQINKIEIKFIHAGLKQVALKFRYF